MEQTKIGRLIVDRGERFIRLVDLSLLPEYRSRGIGTSILLSLQEESADTGRPIVLQVFETNRAKTLYQRLGFVCTAKEGMYETMQWRPQASRIT
jgi:ribosomal protein S18 acetylase RimI-like enzyme